MSHFGPSALFLVLCSINQAASDVYYITTNSTDFCTVQPCLILSQFAANSSHYLNSKTTVVFLPGSHHLTTVNLTLTSADKFVMKSEAGSIAQIQCTNGLSIHFIQLQQVDIDNLQLIGCGGNQVNDVEEFVVEDTKFESQENSGRALKLVETTAKIINSTCESNGRGSYSKCVIYFIDDPGYGCGFIGGAIILPSTVQLISAKASLKVIEQALVELYLQSSTARLT